jgi:lipopolysaccharide/colanic/teichoic acid biosynthesis glycosyltransferase
MTWNRIAGEVRAADSSAALPIQPPQHVSPSRYFRWKGILDRAAAAVLLVPGLPIIALLVLLVRLTSPGPGIYRQARVGSKGRRFVLYKVRTMRQDAETKAGPVWTQPRDPRVTRVGKVLRRLHLDELPQLFNVLKGEMSLVGPRPERPEFIRVLAEVIPEYTDRLAVPPGITGLAQINLPPDSDLASVRRKLVPDFEYIERGGLWLDLRILLHTLFRIFKVPENWLFALLRLQCKPAVAAGAEGPSPNGADGAGSVQTTPTDILIQAVAPPAGPAAERSGRGAGRRGKRRRGRPR